MVVKAGGTAGFQQLSHAHDGAVVDGLAVQVFPNLIEGGEPVEELQVLHLGQVAAEGLVEMVVGVDQAGIDDAPAGVQGLVRRLGLGTHVGDDAVPDQNIGAFQQVVLIVAGDDGPGVLNQKAAHTVLLPYTRSPREIIQAAGTSNKKTTGPGRCPGLVVNCSGSW